MSGKRVLGVVGGEKTRSLEPRTLSRMRGLFCAWAHAPRTFLKRRARARRSPRLPLPAGPPGLGGRDLVMTCVPGRFLLGNATNPVPRSAANALGGTRVLTRSCRSWWSGRYWARFIGAYLTAVVLL